MTFHQKKWRLTKRCNDRLWNTIRRQNFRQGINLIIGCTERGGTSSFRHVFVIDLWTSSVGKTFAFQLPFKDHTAASYFPLLIFQTDLSPYLKKSLLRNDRVAKDKNLPILTEAIKLFFSEIIGKKFIGFNNLTQNVMLNIIYFHRIFHHIFFCMCCNIFLYSAPQPPWSLQN